MAFMKMVGLEVTPLTPSSLTMRARVPRRMTAREMLSYQMLWPKRPISCTLDLGMAFLRK